MSYLSQWNHVKFMLSKKATKIDEIFAIDLMLTVYNLKLTVKISSIFVAFLDNMNFNQISFTFFNFSKPVLLRKVMLIDQ